MRRSLLTSLVLAFGGLVFALSAKATPIHVGLTGAAGQQSWNSPGFGDPSFLTLSAWEDDGNGWVPAWMTAGDDGHGNSGLGVCGQQPDSNNVCESGDETNQIDSTPSQMIDMDIHDLHSDWTKITITLLSVESSSEPLLSGVDCSILTDTNCSPTPVALDPNASFCSGPDANAIVTCVFTEQYLTGITDIWIQSQRYNCTPPGTVTHEDFCPGNILLGSGYNGFIMDGTPVPEPAALGMFGLGVLLIGVFLGLRRRKRQAN